MAAMPAESMQPSAEVTPDNSAEVLDFPSANEQFDPTTSPAIWEEAYSLIGQHVPPYRDDGVYGDQEDIIQEAMLAAWRHSSEFEGDREDFNKLLNHITRNKKIDHWRANQRERTRVKHLESLGNKGIAWRGKGLTKFSRFGSGNPSDILDLETSFTEDYVTTYELIKKVLEEIAEGSSVGYEAVQTLFKHRFEGVSHKVIAAELAIKEVASKCRLLRVRRQLADVIFAAENLETAD